jgi:hypothetical protein
MSCVLTPERIHPALQKEEFADARASSGSIDVEKDTNSDPLANENVYSEMPCANRGIFSGQDRVCFESLGKRIKNDAKIENNERKRIFIVHLLKD